MDKKDEQLKSLNQESARSQQEYAHKRKEVTNLIINQSNQKRVYSTVFLYFRSLLREVLRTEATKSVEPKTPGNQTYNCKPNCDHIFNACPQKKACLTKT